MHDTFNAHTSLWVIKCQLYPRPTLAMACPVFNPHHGITILLMFLISFSRSETTSRSIQHVLFLFASFHSAFEKFISIVLINSISFIFITKDSSKVFISIILDVISRFVVLQVTPLRMVFSMSFSCACEYNSMGELHSFQHTDADTHSVDSARERPRHSRAWSILGLAILLKFKPHDHAQTPHCGFHCAFMVTNKIGHIFHVYLALWITSFTKDTLKCHTHVKLFSLFLVDLRAFY